MKTWVRGWPVPRARSSSSARIGAEPVPPATISTSRPLSRSTCIRPIGGPIRQVSPTRVCATIARLTHPFGTARTWNSSRPSARGAIAGER